MIYLISHENRNSIILSLKDYISLNLRIRAFEFYLNSDLHIITNLSPKRVSLEESNQFTTILPLFHSELL